MFDFTIVRDDSIATSGLSEARVRSIEDVLVAALDYWGRYINAPDANIEINFFIGSLGSLASAGPRFYSSGDGPLMDIVNGELTSNSDNGPFDIDATLNLNVDFLLDEDFFFIDPIYRPNPEGIGANQIDLLTLFAHEISHILGFSSFGEALYFENVEEIDGEFFFVGENATAANNGQNIQLDSSNVSHFSGTAGDLVNALIPRGERLPITPLHIAVLEDLGLPITQESAGDDIVHGFEEFSDNLNGLAGNDVIFGYSGNDTLTGGAGNDNLDGGLGEDLLLGDAARALTLDSQEGELFRAFQAVFDRAPDAGGFNAFLTEMRLGNITQEEVIAEFVESVEFRNTFSDLDNQGFVEQLFRNVLDREGDAQGIEAFTNELDVGRSRASVVVEFANSPEFVQVTALSSAAFATNVIINPAEGQVFRIYQAVLLRDPDEAGFTAFTNSIQAGVLTVEEITAEFVASEEFQITYGDLDNAAFVELLFTNVLPGNMDIAGQAAFTEALNIGTLTREVMVAEFVEAFEFVRRMADPAIEFVSNTFTSSRDTLDGGTGDDILFGGRGADQFSFDTQDGGADTILDFTSGTDSLDIGADEAFDTFSEVMAVSTQVGLDSVFDFGEGNTLTLEGVVLNDLTADDFGFDEDASTSKTESYHPKVDIIAFRDVNEEMIFDIGDTDTYDMFG